MLNKKQCYLCGDRKFRQRSGTVRDKTELEVFECASCGLVFLSSFDHIRDDFYGNSEMHGEEMLDVQTWLKKTASDDERWFQYLKPVLGNCRLLDFGCGAGGFLLKARECAETACGIEPENRLRDHFKKCNLTVFPDICGLRINMQKEKYDVITMFHVLEHLRDPKDVLCELRGILNGKGRIVIEVPNAEDALLTLYNSGPFSDFTYWSCHLFLYSVKTLQMLFEKADLKVNYIDQVQRYPLSNHLFWLSEGKAGGHQKWDFLNSLELHSAYEKQLASIGKCDTIIASVSKM